MFLKGVEKRFGKGHCFGLEPSKAAIEKKVCDAPIVNSLLEEWRPSEPGPKTACMIDVIEHLRDPASALRLIHEYAEQLVVVCPNFNYCRARWDMLQGRIPFQNKQARGGHIFWCELRGMMKFFHETGFKVIDTNHQYPRQNRQILRSLLAVKPAFFAHTFAFLLKAI